MEQIRDSDPRALAQAEDASEQVAVTEGTEETAGLPQVPSQELTDLLMALKNLDLTSSEGHDIRKYIEEIGGEVSSFQHAGQKYERLLVSIEHEKITTEAAQELHRLNDRCPRKAFAAPGPGSAPGSESSHTGTSAMGKQNKPAGGAEPESPSEIGSKGMQSGQSLSEHAYPSTFGGRPEDICISGGHGVNNHDARERAEVETEAAEKGAVGKEGKCSAGDVASGGDPDFQTGLDRKGEDPREGAESGAAGEGGEAVPGAPEGIGQSPPLDKMDSWRR